MITSWERDRGRYAGGDRRGETGGVLRRDGRVKRMERDRERAKGKRNIGKETEEKGERKTEER
jgi:hypothetical protein